MYIEIEEFKTHAYEEELMAIIRDDETIALASLDMAIEYAESKLNKVYDTELIFSKRKTADVDPRSPLLVKIIKDIAIWEMMGLCNVSINYDDKKFRYQEAINWLNAVYKGMPVNLPKKEVEEKSSSFTYKSNKKRQNYE